MNDQYYVCLLPAVFLFHWAATFCDALVLSTSATFALRHAARYAVDLDSIVYIQMSVKIIYSKFYIWQPIYLLV